MHQILSDAEDLVIKDVISDDFEVIQSELPSYMIYSVEGGKEVITIDIGRVHVGEKITINIPIKIKERSKPTDGSTVTYPTNDLAVATYVNFQYKNKQIDDTNGTEALDRIDKPELSYPDVVGPPHPIDTFKVTYDDGVSDLTLDVPVDHNNYHLNNEVIIMTETIPKRTGFTFVGWKDEDVNPVIISEGKFNMPNRDVVLTAQWQNPFLYSVIYTDGVDGETIFEDQATYNLSSGTKTPLFYIKEDVDQSDKEDLENGIQRMNFISTNLRSGQVPLREGYDFIGWNPEVSTLVYDNAIYTAQWKKKEPLITPEPEVSPTPEISATSSPKPQVNEVKPVVKIPYTGDKSNTSRWLLLAIISGVTMLVQNKKRIKTK